MTILKEALAELVGLLLILVVIWDSFETIILPRTVTRRVRLTRLFYLTFGAGWFTLVRGISSGERRERLLGAYGPLSLLLLFVFWALCLMMGFALVLWGLDIPISSPDQVRSFGADLYFSGVTFLTLGFGDITPRSGLGRFLAVMEAGLGFGFLAIVISYLPVMYQSFSRREVTILLLDSRAGTPPTALELLRRYGEADTIEMLPDLLKDMERWSAELLESYLSYPVLAYYRSQHDTVSWLSALTAILDTSALVQIGFKGDPPWQKALTWQAKLTFAMARHMIVDLALILNVPPVTPKPERLSLAGWQYLCDQLALSGLSLCDSEASQAELWELRRQYEPYVYGMAQRLILELPPWTIEAHHPDNWQTSAWENMTHL